MELKVYIDRLKDGGEEKLSASISTAFLEIEDSELTFDETLSLSGEAYVTDDHLILRFEAKTCAYVPCSICNSPVKIPILLSNFYHAEPIEEIPSAVFDFSEILREDILIQVPLFAECQNGNCPEREHVKNILKQTPSGQNPASSHSVQFPFSNLDNE